MSAKSDGMRQPPPMVLVLLACIFMVAGSEAQLFEPRLMVMNGGALTVHLNQATCAGTPALSVPGGNFSCVIGRHATHVPVAVDGGGRATCGVPPQSSPGLLSVELKANNTIPCWHTSSSQATYSINFFGVAGLEPLAGPTIGSTLVTIQLTNFDVTLLPGAQALCRFITSDAAFNRTTLLATTVAQQLTQERFFCSTPAFPLMIPEGQNSSVTFLSISLDAGTTWIDDINKAFIYYEQPLVESISLKSGPHVGGTKLTVFGQRFAPYLLTKCIFGTKDATSTVVVSPSVMVCTSPKVDRPIGSSEVVATLVSVALNGQNNQAVAGAALNTTFSYLPDFTLSSIQPAALPLAAGIRTVTVFGRQLRSQPLNADLIRVQFGDVLVVPDSVAADGNSLTAQAPDVWSISKSGFSASNVAHSNISLSGLEVRVQVTLNGQQYVGITNSEVADLEGTRLRFFTAYRLVPAFGPYQGSTSVTVFGAFLGMRSMPYSSSQYKCQFNGIVVSGVPFNSTQQVPGSSNFDLGIVCQSPPYNGTNSPLALSGSGALMADVTVSVFTDSAPSSPSIRYEYNDLPQTIRALPSIGPLNGGFDLKIEGASFKDSGEQLKCKFKYANTEIIQQAKFQSSTAVLCPLPSAPVVVTDAANYVPGLSVNISISTNGQQYSLSSASFLQFGFQKIDPLGGPSIASTEVTLTTIASASNLTCRYGLHAAITANPTVCTDEAIRLANTGSPSAVKACFSDSPGVISQSNSNSNEKYWKCTYPPQALPASILVRDAPIFFSVDGTETFFNGGNMQFYFNLRHFPVNSFSYYELQSVTDIRPSSGPNKGGSQVTIQGTNILPVSFSFIGSVLCRFGDGPISSAAVRQPISGATDLILVCATHAVQSGLAPARSKLQISYNGQYFANTTADFYYYSLTSINPSKGPPRGGTVVQLKGVNLGQGSNSGTEIRCRFWLDIEVEGEYNPFQDVVTCQAPAWPSDLGDEVKVVLEVSLNFLPDHYTDNALFFEYYPQPGVSISNVEPSAVPRGIATPLIIQGDLFRNSSVLQTRFSSIGRTISTVFRNSSFLTAQFDQYSATARSLVSVTLNGQDYDPVSPTAGLDIYGIDRVSPASGPVTGGLTLNIFGNFIPEPSPAGLIGACLFSIANVQFASAPLDRQSESYVTCRLPSAPGLTPASITIDIQVQYDKGFKTTDALAFQYFGVFSVSSVFPSQGQLSGGTQVTINGASFVSTATLKCKFDTSEVSAVFLSANQMTCVSPASTSEIPVTVPVLLSLNGIDFTQASNSFNYVSEPFIDLLRPSEFPSKQTSTPTITVLGSRFENATTLSCRFATVDVGMIPGGEVIVAATFVSEFQVLCPTPQPQNGGNISVQIAIDGQRFSPRTNPKEIQAYDIHKVSPTVAIRSRPLRLEMEGRNLRFSAGACGLISAVTGQRLNGTAVFNSSVDANLGISRHVCFLSSLDSIDAGQYLVIISPISDNSGREFISNSSITISLQHFDPEHSAVLPTLGVTLGGFTVTVQGSHFVDSSELSVNFGSAGLMPATFVSSTSITVTAPLSAAVDQPIQVSLNAQQLSDTNQTILFYGIPEVLAIEPASVPRQGNLTITVLGRGFRALQNAACAFNCSSNTFSPRQIWPDVASAQNLRCVLQSPATVLSDGQLTCLTPSVELLNSEMDLVHWVSVTLEGTQFSVVNAPLFYFDIVSLSPPSAPNVGGTMLDIVSLNSLNISSTMSCLFMIPTLNFSVTVNGTGKQSTLQPWWKSDSQNLHHFDIIQCTTPAIPSNLTSLGATEYLPGILRASLDANNAAEYQSMIQLNVQFYQPSVVHGIVPSIASAAGGSHLIVKGLNFKSTPLLRCSLHPNMAPTVASFINSTAIQCPAPKVCFNGTRMLGCESNTILANTSLQLSVSMNAQQFTTASVPFLSFAVLDVLPSGGIFSGSTVVTISGPQLHSMGQVANPQCRFKNIETTATVIGINQLRCSTPRRIDPEELVEVRITHDQIFTADRQRYFYHSEYPFFRLRPIGLPLSGGTVIVELDSSELYGPNEFVPYHPQGMLIRMSNFSGNFPVTALDRTRISFVAPSAVYPWQAQIFVSYNRYDYTASPVILNYQWTTLVEPSGGVYGQCDKFDFSSLHPGDGTDILVLGENFEFDSNQMVSGGSNVPRCKVGSMIVDGTWDSIRKGVRCRTPQVIADAAGQALNFDLFVEVSLNGADFTQSASAPNRGKFTMYKQPCVYDVFPKASPMGGGDWVTVVGKDFFQQAGLLPKCKFGQDSAAVDGEILSTTSMRCISPSRTSPGTVRLAVSLNGQQFDFSDGYSFDFHYFFIRSLEPALGNKRGGTIITVSGINLGTPGFPQIRLGPEIVGNCSTVTTAYPDGYLVCEVPPSQSIQEVSVAVRMGLTAKNSAFGNSFLFHGDFEFFDFTPKAGLREGGTVVTITGKDFPNRRELSCLFGAVQSSSVFINSGLILCNAPSRSNPQVQVQVTTTGQTVDSTTCTQCFFEGSRLDFFTYYGQAIMTQVAPRALSRAGGTILTVRGLRVSTITGGNYTCKVGETIFSGYIDTAGAVPGLNCLILPGLAKGVHAVEIAMNGQEFTSTGEFPINVFDPLHIQNLFPKGVAIGRDGQSITIVGYGLLEKDPTNTKGTISGPVVRVGGENINAEYKDNSHVVFQAPLLAAGSPATQRSVELTVNDQDFTTSGLVLDFYEWDATAGCPRDCNGRGTCISQWVWDDQRQQEVQEFRCACRPIFAGLDCSGSFAMVNMIPRSGPQTGGTAVSITGFNLFLATDSTNYRCKFGSQQVQAKYTEPTTLVCVTPAYYLNGTVGVEISIDNGTTWTNEGHVHLFAFQLQPSIGRIEPSIAPALGHTVVRVLSDRNHTFTTAPYDANACVNEPFCEWRLNRHHDGLACRFGDVVSTEARFVNIHEIACIAPAAPSTIFPTGITFSEVVVSLTLNGQQLLPDVFRFMYIGNTTFQNVLPSISALQGQSTITVKGAGFVNTADLKCKFGFAAAPSVTYGDSNTLLVQTPFQQNPSTVVMQCTFNGQQWQQVSNFQYIEMWTIAGLQPSYGPETGGSYVTVTGLNFVDSSALACKVGDVLSVAGNGTRGPMFLSNTTILCPTPASIIPRPPFSNEGADQCTGYFFKGFRRNLCLSGNFDCSWKILDGTTQYLQCNLQDFGEVIVSSPVDVDRLTTDKENFHPDVPLRQTKDVFLSLDGSNWVKFTAEPGQPDQKFLFFELPNVTNVDPNIAPVNTSATLITVHGEGFQPFNDLSCLFGDTPSPETTFISPFQVRCQVPFLNVSLTEMASALYRTVTLKLRLNSHQVTNENPQFYYANIWEVKSITPSSGPVIGSTWITVKASFIRPTSLLTCQFGQGLFATAVEFVDESTMKCRSPAVGKDDVVAVEITVDGKHWSTSNVLYQFLGMRNLLTFGDNSFGQAAIPESFSNTPKFLGSIRATDVNGMAAGDQHSLAVASQTFNDTFGTVPQAGLVYVWGNNFVGQLGLGDLRSRTEPEIIRTCLLVGSFGECIRRFDEEFIVEVAAGSYHSLALTREGIVFAFGWNTKRQLGQGVLIQEPNSATPLFVHTLKNANIKIVKIAAGFSHSVAAADDGKLWVWGNNDRGQLGLGDTINRNTPTSLVLQDEFSQTLQIRQISCGLFHTVVLASDGEVYTFGSHSSGQLGLCKSAIDLATGGCSSEPMQIGAEFQFFTSPRRVEILKGRNVQYISAGALHTIAVTQAGDLFTWGHNQYGQLGLGFAGADRSVPLPALVSSLETAGTICSGLSFAEQCIERQTWERTGAEVGLVSTGFYHTFVQLRRKQPLGYKGNQKFVTTMFSMGNNDRGQLGQGFDVAFVDKPALVFLPNSTYALFPDQTGGGKHSALLHTCPPSVAAPCSGNGQCRSDGSCFCNVGFRGFDCSFQCDGGANNMCGGHGNATLAKIISERLFGAMKHIGGGSLHNLQQNLLNDPAVTFSADNSTKYIPKSLIRTSFRNMEQTSPSLNFLIKTWLGDTNTGLVGKIDNSTKYPVVTSAANPSVASATMAALFLDFQTDGLNSKLVAADYLTRSAQIERVWRNHRIECPACSFDQLSLETGLSAFQVEVIWKHVNARSDEVAQRLADTYSTTLVSIRRIWSSLDSNCLSCSLNVRDEGCLFDGSCLCQPGWTGDDCSIECNGGFENPCSGNGVCQEDGSCICSSEEGADLGFRGSLCNIACAGGNENICNGHGTCIADGSCICETGYRRFDCALECPGLLVTDTATQVCTAHGQCTNDARCVCDSGYVKTDCSVECDGGAETPCNGNGRCIDDREPFGQCVCNEGFRNSTCNIECNGGFDNICAGNGICGADGSCTCFEGFRGDNCTIQCAGGFENPCNGNGVCLGNGTCICNPGFRSADCGIECLGGALTPCNLHGQCLEDGSCECDVLFRGEDCGKKCPGDDPPCSGRGICDENANCICESTYEGVACEKFATWTIATISVSSGAMLISLVIVYYKVRRARIRAKRRMRREIRKGTDDKKRGIRTRVVRARRPRNYTVKDPTAEQEEAKQKEDGGASSEEDSDGVQRNAGIDLTRGTSPTKSSAVMQQNTGKVELAQSQKKNVDGTAKKALGDLGSDEDDESSDDGQDVGIKKQAVHANVEPNANSGDKPTPPASHAQVSARRPHLPSNMELASARAHLPPLQRPKARVPLPAAGVVEDSGALPSPRRANALPTLAPAGREGADARRTVAITRDMGNSSWEDTTTSEDER